MKPNETIEACKELIELFNMERPRIVGRPKTRRAALTAWAGVRKRVFLKSPVRENRTPGSVRGLSGDWQSYRDGRHIAEEGKEAMSNKELMVQLFVLLIIGLLTVGCGGTQEESSAPSPIPPTSTHIAPTATPSEGEGVLQLARKITWLRSNSLYGHAGIMIQADDQVIYLDPVDLANKEGLPKADIILVTHDHRDHFSSETIASLSTESTKIVSIESITSKIDGQNALALSPGQKTTVDGFEIEGIPAYNTNHPKASGYLGFLLSVNGIRVYCSGDTGLISEMESLSNIDIAVLNVRKPYALSGEQVVKFAEIVKPQIIIPIHWMPDDNTYKDIEEIEYIQQNIPETTILSVLELN